MEKDEVNIPQRGRPRKGREIGPKMMLGNAPEKMAGQNLDFDGVFDTESVDDLLQKEYWKYMDRNKAEPRRAPDVGQRRKTNDVKREFQSQGRMMSHVSSIFPEKAFSETYEKRRSDLGFADTDGGNECFANENTQAMDEEDEHEMFYGAERHSARKDSELEPRMGQRFAPRRYDDYERSFGGCHGGRCPTQCRGDFGDAERERDFEMRPMAEFPPPSDYRYARPAERDQFFPREDEYAKLGMSLGQTLSHSSNVLNFEPDPSNPLFQNYSLWVNRKKRKNNPLLWQYINQSGFVHPSRYSSLDYVHKKMYLGTITQVPVEKNNHQILPLFLNSATSTAEFVRIGEIFLERTKGLNYDNVTVMQLKNLMKEFGLCHNGKKSELIERVKATVHKIETKTKKDAGCDRRESGESDASFLYF